MEYTQNGYRLAKVEGDFNYEVTDDSFNGSFSTSLIKIEFVVRDVGSPDLCLIQETNVFDKIDDIEQGFGFFKDWFGGIIIVFIVLGLLFFAFMIFWLWIIIDAIKSKKKFNREMWLVLLILLPLSAFVYLFVVKLNKNLEIRPENKDILEV